MLQFSGKIFVNLRVLRERMANCNFFVRIQRKSRINGNKVNLFFRAYFTRRRAFSAGRVSLSTALKATRISRVFIVCIPAAKCRPLTPANHFAGRHHEDFGGRPVKNNGNICHKVFYVLKAHNRDQASVACSFFPPESAPLKKFTATTHN